MIKQVHNRRKYHFKASYRKAFNNILTANWFSFLWNGKPKIVCILFAVSVLSDTLLCSDIVIYRQCCVLIGWATSRLYVIAVKDLESWRFER